MKRVAYMENANGVVGPLNADLTVLRAGEMVEEEFEEGVAFFGFEADDACRIWGGWVCGEHVSWEGELNWRKDLHIGLTKRHFSPVTSCVLTTG